MIESTQRRNFYYVKYIKALGINKVLEITVKPNKYINYMKGLDIFLLSFCCKEISQIELSL